MGFRILWARFQIPKPRSLDSTSKIFPESGFHKQKFPGFGESGLHWVKWPSRLESRFLEQPWEKQTGLNYQEVILKTPGVKLMCLTDKGKLCLVWIIRNFEKSRVREIGILLLISAMYSCTKRHVEASENCFLYGLCRPIFRFLGLTAEVLNTN